MIAWNASDAENLVSPNVGLALLGRAISAQPDDARLHEKLGNLHFDRFDFGRAARAFEAAVDREPDHDAARLRLARCWNRLGRHADVLRFLGESKRAACADSHLQRGVAFASLGRSEQAELSFRAALDLDPHHRHACFELCTLLRLAGRYIELLSVCDALVEKKVVHAQLLLDRGRALAHNGHLREAARLLFNPGRLVRTTLRPPRGFGSLRAFNSALAEELLSNPYAMTEVPMDEVAMRGAARVHHLMNGNRPELIRMLFAEIEVSVEAYAREMTAPPGDVDPWCDARPRRAGLHAWGLIQKSGDYEEWHTHRGGWLSGVYYARIPETFSIAGAGQGCIEFGAPPSLAEAGIAIVDPLRVAPCEGLLLLAPSHYHHRTIPFVSPGLRICVAFDVQRLEP